ncbi:hypothetical protein PG999_005825 [Apiospora kogelbergensis]|uniref:Secreted protein n=1 Tax=Apiospora kogelbergensis TaxID=1337665 RepID=A0AAW0QQI0_9PEZI
MQVRTAITAVLGSSISFSAAAPHPRANIPSELNITGLAASTESGKPAAHFAFAVSIPGGGDAIKCSFYGRAAAGGLLPDVAWRPCDDPTVQWQFRHEPSRPGTSGPYLLVVTYRVDAQTGQRSYKGESNFVVANLSEGYELARGGMEAR